MQNKVIEDIEVFCIQSPSHTDVLLECKYCDHFYVSSSIPEEMKTQVAS